MAAWQSKDYWGAMLEWTRGFGLIQAGARQGLVTLTVHSEILPGTRDPDYLQAAWYDWAVAGLLLREWDEILGAAERSAVGELEAAPSLEQVALWRALGEWHALRGEWSDALRDAQACLQFNQGDSSDHVTMDYVNAALASLQLGDENGYRHLREAMALRFQEPDDWLAERILGVGLLRSLDDPTVARLRPLAARLDRAVASGDEAASRPPLLGLFHYRCGDYGKAIEWTHRSISKFAAVAQPHALARVILAMSLHQLGDLPAAREELAHAKHLVETGFDLEFDIWWWRHWVLVRLLLQEAESLMPQTRSPQPIVTPP